MAKPRYRTRIELLQGTLDLLILRTLQWGPEHGYGISQAIRTASGERLTVETGSLYPALHRLERQGWIASQWGVSGNGQRAKFYRLTALGRRQMVRQDSRWAEFVEAVSRVGRPAPEVRATPEASA
jgi:PadR family transcriptional regulator